MSLARKLNESFEMNEADYVLNQKGKDLKNLTPKLDEVIKYIKSLQKGFDNKGPMRYQDWIGDIEKIKSQANDLFDNMQYRYYMDKRD